MSRLAALLAVATLSACGAAADDPLLGVARGLVQGVFNRDAEVTTVDPRQVLTRDIINQAGLPLILVERHATGTGVTMVRSAVNGTDETWQGDGGAAFTLSREGVLRATRGAGADLYAADIAGTRAALAGGRTGTVGRLHVHVAGDLEQRQTSFRCEITRGGQERIEIFGQARVLTRVTEACHRDPAGDYGFENRYWVDSSGFAWVSEQWAGPELGTFRIERLFR
ncbi:YjbF family lipoprotein [Rhodobacteraceae bacterium N5(2021)]|uniref:YjbF family lipoprotein n=1 Tax=Gymnodinialimonas phycosphaerae TaxID=2841589 RepID=A0A975TRU1_9RHOB|nr:YjbF family lipoprotein [Gymnodinialimonas phycosphaerae]MBY4893384.1 YjbF family lipoprotein [Gymnodinialimonas phycosphaerae]